jgi:hypothetical protein
MTGVSDRDRCPVPRTRVLLEQDILISPHAIYDCLSRGEHRKYNRNNNEGVSCISEVKYPSMPQAPNNTRRTGHQFGHRLGDTVRKGRLFSQHQLNINSVRIRSSNQCIYSSRSAISEESFQLPRTTLVIRRDILSIPWLPGKWLLGLIRKPGLWAHCSPCTPVLDCRSIRYTLRASTLRHPLWKTFNW